MFKFNTKKIAIATLIGAGLLSLGACADGGSLSTLPGNLNGLGNDPMTMGVIHKNRDYCDAAHQNNCFASTAEYKVVAVHANDCMRDNKMQQSGLVEAMATNGVVDGGFGFVGGSQAESVEASKLHQVLKAGARGAVGAFNGVANGIQGAGNGLKIKSSAVVSVVIPCTNQDLHMPLTAAKVPGISFNASYLRTNNSSVRYPSWVSKAPAAQLPQGRGPQTDYSASDQPAPQN